MPFSAAHKEHFLTLSRLKMPRVQRVLASMVLFGIAGIVAFLIFAPWIQTASGMGQVIALNPEDRVQNVTALVSGRIERWYVQDGSLVQEGDPIVQLADNDPNLLQSLAAERAQVDAAIAAAATALSTARLDVNRTAQLYSEGLASRRELEQTRIRVAELEARVAEVRAERTRVDINLSRQSVQLVRAPRDGVIQRIAGGDSATLVSQGDVLATFAPVEAERVVELYIDGRDVPLITPGRRVRMEFEGWPAIQVSGWESVARGMFDGRVQTVDLASSPNGLFRVLVVPDPDKAPWPREPFVRLGANVRGWVLLEEVSVGFELWRQLNDFPLQNPDIGTNSGTDGPSDSNGINSSTTGSGGG